MTGSVRAKGGGPGGLRFPGRVRERSVTTTGKKKVDPSENEHTTQQLRSGERHGVSVVQDVTSLGWWRNEETVLHKVRRKKEGRKVP